MVSVKEDFRAYAPPSWVAPTVRRLLDSLPREHLIGLPSVVLTESGLTERAKIRRSVDPRLAGHEPTLFARLSKRVDVSS
jgi:hypothetical protein